MELLRTPDDRFADLPDYPYEPRYVTVRCTDDPTPLRMAYVTVGPDDAAETVLMLHGEPSWGFLYRKVAAVCAAAGIRSIIPDLIGFGRSDKPTETTDYTYTRHVEWVWDLIQQVCPDEVTLLCQDWGGLLGLRNVGEHPERFRRVVVANTFLPTGDGKPSDAFLNWQNFAATTPTFPVGRIVAGGTANGLSDAEIAAYDAPYPDESFKAGARIFPSLVVTAPDQAGAAENRAAWAVLETFDKPFLTAHSDQDAITAGTDKPFQTRVPGAAGQPHTITEGGGHFLQEDCGEALGQTVVSFIGG
jgi:haloalkane dehalogenase